MEHRVGDLVGQRYIQWNVDHTDSYLGLSIGIIKSIEDLHYSVDWSDPVMNQHGAKYYLPSEILRMKEDINKYVNGEWKAKASNH
jgi:hypothetical protein